MVPCAGVPLAERVLLRGEPSASTPFHCLRKFAHGVRRDGEAFAASKRGFGLINGGKNFRSGALALLPQRESLFNCIPLAAQAGVGAGTCTTSSAPSPPGGAQSVTLPDGGTAYAGGSPTSVRALVWEPAGR